MSWWKVAGGTRTIACCASARDARTADSMSRRSGDRTRCHSFLFLRRVIFFTGDLFSCVKEELLSHLIFKKANSKKPARAAVAGRPRPRRPSAAQTCALQSEDILYFTHFTSRTLKYGFVGSTALTILYRPVSRSRAGPCHESPAVV